MARQPNFLFLITDQQRKDYLGVNGHKVLKTPHLDTLAARGTNFQRFQVASPICMPNRASLLTGRLPSTHGLRHNGNPLPGNTVTFVDVLREGGYRTAAIGKSHLQPFTPVPAYERVNPDTIGPIKEARWPDGNPYDLERPETYEGDKRFEFTEPFYGFEHVDMVLNHGHLAGGHYLQWLRKTGVDIDFIRDRNNELPHDYTCPQAYRTPIPEELYHTSYIRDRAIDYLNAQQSSEAPFSLSSPSRTRTIPSTHRGNTGNCTIRTALKCRCRLRPTRIPFHRCRRRWSCTSKVPHLQRRRRSSLQNNGRFRRRWPDLWHDIHD